MQSLCHNCGYVLHAVHALWHTIRVVCSHDLHPLVTLLALVQARLVFSVLCLVSDQRIVQQCVWVLVVPAPTLHVYTCPRFCGSREAVAAR